MSIKLTAVPPLQSVPGNRFLQHICFALLLVLIPWTGQARTSDPMQKTADRIQQKLASKPAANGGLVAEAAVRRFYRDREYQPAWQDESGIRPLAESVLRVVQLSRFDGLEPSDYHEAALIRLMRKTTANTASPAARVWARLDVLLTDAFLGMAGDLRFGMTGTDDIQDNDLRSRTILDSLDQLLENGRIFSLLDHLRPDTEGYEALRQALGRYLRIRAKGGWQQIPPGPALNPGDRDDRIPLLKNRLAATGDLKPGPGETDDDGGTLFDDRLETALRHFQWRHHLRRSGILDRETLVALNIPPAGRISQIRLNMDLRRQLPDDPGHHYLLVNIPGMELRGFRDGKPVLSMRVIVGRPNHQTPIFDDEIAFLIINPYWYIPPEIVEEEILPGMKHNPDYLDIRGIHLFRKMSADRDEVNPDGVDWQKLTPDRIDFYFRQDPGMHNSLGKIKFVMHNREHIYLHDTPSRQLFEEEKRDLSFGCIRVEKSLDLAAFIMAGHPVWTRHKIGEMMENGRQKKIVLTHPLPVHVVYWTVTVDRHNRLIFLPDVYHLESDWISRLRPRRKAENSL